MAASESQGSQEENQVRFRVPSSSAIKFFLEFCVCVSWLREESGVGFDDGTPKPAFQRCGDLSAHCARQSSDRPRRDQIVHDFAGQNRQICGLYVDLGWT
jgi:hypothetical protein